MRKYTFIVILALCSLPAFANGSLVQRCGQNNSTFFPTTTASCSLTGVAAGHFILIAGFSCTNTCEANGTQATHAVADTLGLAYGNITYTLFANKNGAGNWAADSLWCVATGASSGNDTVTLTLNASSGNGIEVEEWAGLSSCSPTGTGSPSVVQSIYPGGGSSPHTFTGGTITIGGAANVATVLGGNGASASSYLVQFIEFPATSGVPLLVIYGDCDNCGGLFGSLPAGYTVRASGIGDSDSVLMTSNATVGAGVPRRKGWIL